MVTTQERQRSNEILFGNESGLFNLDHNLQAYNNLVREKYSDTVTNARPDFQSDFQPAPVPERAQLESYYQPEQKVYTPTQSHQLEGYMSSPIPAPSFRPKIFDSNLEEIDFATSSRLTKIADVELNLESDRAQAQTPAAVSDSVTVTRLSPKGIIAVVGFIAVAALVLALIIINSVGIAGAASRISTSRANQAALNTQLTAAQTQYNAEAVTAQKLANQTVFGAGVNADGTLASGYSTVKPASLPPATPINSAGNSDVSTNWFDQLGRFLSRLFRG